jgi:hypothetical protein
MKNIVSKKHTVFVISLIVILLATTILIPVLLNRGGNSDIAATVPGYEQIVGDEDRTVVVDGYEITIPANNKFVQWATEGKSFIVEDVHGIQSIIIMEFD